MSDTREVTGEVTQVIPPDKHRKYSVSDDVLACADGEYIATLDARDGSRSVLGQIHQLLTWVKDPSNMPEDIYHVVFASEPPEGEPLHVKLEREDIPEELWRAREWVTFASDGGPEVRADGGQTPGEYREELQVVLTSGEDSAICNGAYTAMSAALNAATSLPGNTHVQSIQLSRAERVTTDGREFIFREYPPRHPGEPRQVEVVPDVDVKQAHREPRRWRYVFKVTDWTGNVRLDEDGEHATLRTIYAPDPGNTNAGPRDYTTVAVNGGVRVPGFIRDAVASHLEIEGFGRPPFIPERDGEPVEPEPTAVATDGGLTKACPQCDGAGELVTLEPVDGDREDVVKGVTALKRLRTGDWKHTGVRECLNCAGYGHVDARTGEI